MKLELVTIKQILIADIISMMQPLFEANTIPKDIMKSIQDTSIILEDDQISLDDRIEMMEMVFNDLQYNAQVGYDAKVVITTIVLYIEDYYYGKV